MRVFQFLGRLPEGNKAIVTSRRRSDVDARAIRLDRLALATRCRCWTSWRSATGSWRAPPRPSGRRSTS